MDKQQLLSICPRAYRVDKYLPLLNKYMSEYKITGVYRESAFIAQILHESGKFFYTQEIASGKAYEFRKELGNTSAGDGVKYKGRGFLQITGKFNYQKISKSLGIDFVNKPELLCLPAYCVESACWMWVNMGLNILADNQEFKTITRRINGGLNGYAHRLSFYNKALKVLKDKLPTN